MSSLPVETGPTPEEIEFAKAYLECDRNKKAAGERLWPTLLHPGQKAGKWLQRPGVQYALEAFKDSTKHEVRLWLEESGFGERARVERAATIGKHSQDPLKYIEYCDRRAGVTEEQRDTGFNGNVLEAIVLGAFRVHADGSGAGLCGVRGDLPSHPDQEQWPSAVPVVADAEGQG